MPKTAGLTVVLDWDDAKVKKGVADLNNMFKTGLGNLTVDSSGVTKGTQAATDAISKLRQENKRLTTDFQNLFLADKAFTDQGQRVAESLAARAKMLKEVSAATKNVTDPKLPKVEPVLTALEDLKKRAAEAKTVLENALAGGADPNSTYVLSLVDNYKQLKVQLDAIRQVSSLKLPGVQPAIAEIDRLKAAVKDAKQQLDSFLAGGGSIRSDAGKQLAANYNALNQQLQTLNRTVKGTQDSYARLAQVANAATRHAQNMGVTFGTTSTEFLTASKRAETLTNKLKEVDAATGRHQRNVGNYSSGYNAISTNMARIVGEMPNFAQSMRIGFMAISNNIQPLKESIDDLLRRNKALAAQGKPTTSVLKAIGGALFSWNTLLLVGVTALTAYGPKLVEWAKNIIAGGDAAMFAKKENEALGKALEKSNKQYFEQIGKLTSLNAVLKSDTASRQQKKTAIDELIKQYPGYKEQLIDEYNRTGNVANVIKTQLIPALIAAARARAYEARIGDLSIQAAGLADPLEEKIKEYAELSKKVVPAAKAAGKSVQQYIIDEFNAATKAATQGNWNQSFDDMALAAGQARHEAILMQRSMDLLTGAIDGYQKKIDEVIPKTQNLLKPLKGSKDAKTEAQKLADAIKDVEKSLKGIDTQEDLGVLKYFDAIQERAKTLQSGINKLTEDFNVPASNTTLQQWSKDLIFLNGRIKDTTEANKLAEKQASDAQAAHNKKTQEAIRYNERYNDLFNDLNTSLASVQKSLDAGLITSSEKDKQELDLIESAYKRLITTFNLPLNSETLKTFFNDIAKLKGKTALNDLADDAIKFESRLKQIDVSKSLGVISGSEAEGQRISAMRTRLQGLIEVFSTTTDFTLSEKVRGEIGDLEKELAKAVKIESFSAALQSALTSMASGTIDAVSSIFQKGGGFESFFSGMLDSIGKALQEFGKQLIMIGGLKALIDKAVTALSKMGAAPLVAAAGAAAIVGGVLLQRAAEKQMNRTMAFANGGIISGPTYGLMGEYAGAANNPEVVAPLDKLKSLIGGNTQRVEVVGRISGRDLVLIQDRQQKYNNR